MKILYSCLSESWGGMEMFTITAVNQLLKRNIQTELLCYPNSPIHKEAEKLGIAVKPIKAKGYFNPLQIIKVCRQIKKNDYDIIHTQASKDLWILSPALKLSKKRVKLFLTKQMGSYIVKKDFLHKIIYKSVTAVFAISQVIKNNVLDTCPIEKEKIILLHNAVDIEKFNPNKIDGKKVRNEFGITENKLVIGMLARFSPGKGHEEFLLAAKQLLLKHNNLIFIIVGEPSRGEKEYSETIKKMSIELRIDKQTIFTGFRKDTNYVIGAMDIFVFPSHSEAFGIALAEALAAGKPSVCAKSDGVLDIALDNVTSLLFEPRNYIDLSEKLESLISSEEKRETFGKAARKRAIENFDIELLTDKVINYYNNFLGKS